jgi:hypothetical protein
MARGDWLLIIAVVGLTVLQPVRVPGNAQEDTSEAQSGPKHDAPPIDLSPIADEIKGLSRAIESIRPEGKSADEAQHEKDDLQAQQDMAHWARLMYYATAVTAVLTAAGIVLLGFTLYFTKRAAVAGDEMVVQAKKTTDFTMRAYLVAKAGMAARLVRQSAAFRYDDTEQTFVLALRFDNVGQYPALGITMTAEMVLNSESPSVRFAQFRPRNLIPDLQPKEHTQCLMYADDFALTEAEFEMATNGGVTIEVTVLVIFADGFELVTKREVLEGMLKADALKRLTANLNSAKIDLD